MTELENVFIRGSKIRCASADMHAVRRMPVADLAVHSYILLPDMLKNAPMFKKAAVAKLVCGGPSYDMPRGCGRSRPRLLCVCRAGVVQVGEAGEVQQAAAVGCVFPRSSAHVWRMS